MQADSLDMKFVLVTFEKYAAQFRARVCLNIWSMTPSVYLMLSFTLESGSVSSFFTWLHAFDLVHRSRRFKDACV